MSILSRKSIAVIVMLV